jgi:hypothetical protein
MVWSQPIYTAQNRYPSSILNQWNGELTIDKENNAILAAKVAAGKKNKDDNTFSGVIMGDWSGNDTSSAEGAITENTGIYGFYHGEASFGFRDDGTAFIGKSGHGRLELNGEKSTIQSSTFKENKGGLSLDFDDALIELYEPGKAHKEKKSIIMDARKSYDPFTIGSYFSVDWDGTLDASNGNFSGSISASSISGSTISGGKITGGTITGGTISGTKITTDQLYAGVSKGYSYEKWTRSKASAAWANTGEIYVFTSGDLGDPYYPSGTAETALTMFKNRKEASAEDIAKLGSFEGAIQVYNPTTDTLGTETTKVCGIDITHNSYPLVLRSKQRALLRSDVGDVMIMAGGQVGIWGDSIRFHVPAED